MDDARRTLAEVLRAARELVARPGNDFDWSSWDDAAEACRELDGHIAALERGETPDRTALRVLFAPTGPLQEVAIQSDWSTEFGVLAERFDAAEECL